MNYLLDTNVISELIKKQPNLQVVQWIDEQEARRMYLSVVTIGEIQKGITRLPSSVRKTRFKHGLIRTCVYASIIVFSNSRVP